ncbi:hypothetical protein BC830DRAFT_941498 [Chytriomyces sp. MP71]|nr:hypothetical protein BC830DRAFT_941498 [Chytriomyces sp. MP71]
MIRDVASITICRIHSMYRLFWPHKPGEKSDGNGSHVSGYCCGDLFLWILTLVEPLQVWLNKNLVQFAAVRVDRFQYPQTGNVCLLLWRLITVETYSRGGLRRLLVWNSMGLWPRKNLIQVAKVRVEQLQYPQTESVCLLLRLSPWTLSLLPWNSEGLWSNKNLVQVANPVERLQYPQTELRRLPFASFDSSIVEMHCCWSSNSIPGRNAMIHTSLSITSVLIVVPPPSTTCLECSMLSPCNLNKPHSPIKGIFFR